MKMKNENKTPFFFSFFFLPPSSEAGIWSGLEGGGDMKKKRLDWIRYRSLKIWLKVREEGMIGVF